MGYNLKNSRIVVIDDEEIWTNRIISILKEQNFHFVESKFPIPAFSELSNCYDLAIVDIRMKRFDGFQIKDFFKTESPRTKVLLMSAHDDYDIRILNKSKDADGWFHKNDLEYDELSFIMEVSRLLSENIQFVDSRKEANSNNKIGGNMRDKIDGDKIDINAYKVIFAKNNSTAMSEEYESKAQADNTQLVKLINELSVLAKSISSKLPNDVAENFEDDFDNLSKESQKNCPRKDNCAISAKGLIDAASTVGAIGKPIVELVNSILKIIHS